MTWHAISAALVGSLPVIATEGNLGGVQTELWLAQNAQPADAGAWVEYALPSSVDGNNRCLLDHGGSPALLAVIDGGGVDDAHLIYRYPVP